MWYFVRTYGRRGPESPAIVALAAPSPFASQLLRWSRLAATVLPAWPSGASIRVANCPLLLGPEALDVLLDQYGEPAFNQLHYGCILPMPAGYPLARRPKLRPDSCWAVFERSLTPTDALVHWTWEIDDDCYGHSDTVELSWLRGVCQSPALTGGSL